MATIGGPNIVQNGLTAVFDAGSARSYPGSGTTWFNLSESGNGTLSGTSMGTDTGSINRYVGGRGSSFPFNGKIPIVRVHDLALTASQVLQNFNNIKNRFNI